MPTSTSISSESDFSKDNVFDNNKKSKRKLLIQKENINSKTKTKKSKWTMKRTSTIKTRNNKEKRDDDLNSIFSIKMRYMKMKMKTSHFMNFVDLPNAKKKTFSSYFY